MDLVGNGSSQGAQEVASHSAREGRAVSDEDLRPICACVAFELMQGCAASVDWSAWIVDVHDAYGQHVMTFGFDEIANEVGFLPALAA